MKNHRVRLLVVAVMAPLLFWWVACDDGDTDGGQTSTLTLGVQEQRIVDNLGREWQLRGINARVEGLFDVTFDDGRIPLEPIPDFTAWDAREMVRFGFNYLRLPINWSGLEPAEGQFSDAYLERLDEVLGFCRDAGLFVLIDFHQDAYSKEIGEDGAPLWAIVPPPDELLEGPLEDLEARRLSPQVARAFKSFFENRENIRDRFMPAWRLIVERYSSWDIVVGFEPMNEPFLMPVTASPENLYAFYDDITAVMNDVGSSKPLWLEPDTIRNFTDRAPLRSTPWPYPQVVYCPHLYPFNVSLSTEAEWRAHLAPNLANMRAEADSWGAALVIGEWGGDPSGSGPFPYINVVQDLAEEGLMGQTFWLWKEISQGFWGFYDYDEGTDTWTLREEGARQIGKPYAVCVPGQFTFHDFDDAALRLTVRFDAQGGEGAPVLFLPATWYTNPVVQLEGAVVNASVDPETQRVELPWSGAAGTFEVIVTEAGTP